MTSLTKGQKHPGVPPYWSCEAEERGGPQSTAGSACTPGAQNLLNIEFQGRPFPPDGLPLYFTLTSVVRFKVFQASSLRALVLGRTAEEHQLRTLPLCRGQLSNEPHQVLSMAVFSHYFSRPDSFLEPLLHQMV